MSPIKYNLIYEREDGTIILGRRLKETRRIELEDGTTYSHSWASANLDYKGRITDTEAPRIQRAKWITNANGFKVRVKEYEKR